MSNQQTPTCRPLTLDEFITELEKVCDCSGMGYMKCLERVNKMKKTKTEAMRLMEASDKENDKLKQDNRMLFMENDHLQDLVGKDVKELDKKYKSLHVKYMNVSGEARDLIKQLDNLNEQIETLEKIHNGDMKIVKMLKEKWNEEQEKVKKLLKEDLKILKTYRDEMSKIEKLTNEEVEDILDVAPYIQKLKEENKKLEERIETLDDMGRSYQQELDLEHTRYMEEQGKRADLQVEIEEIRENYIAQEDVNDWIKSGGQVIIDYDEYEETQEIIKKLKEQNEELKEEMKISAEQTRIHIDKCLKVEEQVEELKKELDWWKKKDVRSEIKKSKELQKDVNKIKRDANQISVVMMNICKHYTELYSE